MPGKMWFILSISAEDFGAQVSVCVDDVSNVEDIAAVLESKKDGTQIGIVVEVNVSI